MPAALKKAPRVPLSDGNSIPVIGLGSYIVSTIIRPYDHSTQITALTPTLLKPYEAIVCGLQRKCSSVLQRNFVRYTNDFVCITNDLFVITNALLRTVSS